jgi:hypothetical protein
MAIALNVGLHIFANALVRQAIKNLNEDYELPCVETATILRHRDKADLARAEQVLLKTDMWSKNNRCE